MRYDSARMVRFVLYTVKYKTYVKLFLFSRDQVSSFCISILFWL
jgi:hypothetical protein